MIKIAFVINTIYSPTGGTEKQLLLLLKNLDRSRFSPILCVVHSSDWLEKEFDLCPLYNMNIRSYRSFGTLGRFWEFVRFIKRQKIDIIHTLFKDGMRIGIPAGKLAGIRSIIAVRRSQGYWMTSFDLKITKLINRWVDLIIANSNDTRRWTAEVEGFPQDKIEVIHNGIDLQPFIALSADTRAQYRVKLGIPSDVPVVGIVANLRPVKSIDTFIRAARLVHDALPATRFVLVGDGDQEESLRLMAKDLDLNDNMYFLGRRTDIVPILTTFDVGVLTSISESFSNSIVEYLAAGLPVVCTEVGGAREAVEEGVNGFVVPVKNHEQLANMLIKILGGGRMKTMGEASYRKACDQFSSQSMFRKYEDVYSAIGN